MRLENKIINYFEGKSYRVGIVVARFNQDITDQLLVSTKDYLKDCQVDERNVAVISVAGSAEIPLALQQLARRKRYHCLVALGCIIRGETPHFDYVCKMVQEGVLRVSLDFNIPIGFGVITANNLSQAQERYYLGAEATSAAMELAKIIKKGKAG